MTSRLLTASVLLGGALFVSCVPYPEPGRGDPRKGGTDPNAKVLTPEELEAKKKDELKKKEAAEKEKREKELAAGGLNGTEGKPEGGDGGTAPKPEPKKDKKDWPFANPVPGKEGFVFSPYNNKMVDVRDIPSGTLVQDPTYPAAEQKRFRVP